MYAQHIWLLEVTQTCFEIEIIFEWKKIEKERGEGEGRGGGGV